MPSLNLPALARASGLKRDITLRPIDPTQSHAQELAALYLVVVRVWQREAESILTAYNPSPLATDAPSDHQAAIDRIESEVSRLVLDFGASVRSWALRIERWHRSRWTAAIKAGTGVDLSMILTALPVQETLEAFIARNVALVRDISDQARGRISDAVFRGYQQRTPVREVAKSIREATGMARKRAVRVAADQNMKLSAGLDRERQAEAGIEKFKWGSGTRARITLRGTGRSIRGRRLRQICLGSFRGADAERRRISR
jgi:uncharacterized protein with gpF-like domain